MQQFKDEWSNRSFRTSRLTWLTLFSLLIAYPMLSLYGTDGDPTSLLKNLNEGMRMILLVSTIVMQWCIFLLIYVTVFREKTGLAGLGFQKIQGVDFAWAISFFVLAMAILSGLAWLLALVGLPMPGELRMLIPQDWVGRIVWVGVSLTAGICEEAAFRGYLMSRLRILGRFQSWLIPTVVSSIIFGICHAYQGIPGFILISVYGAMFSLLYIRTKRLWPCIIAHSLQDLMNLFIPQ